MQNSTKRAATIALAVIGFGFSTAAKANVEFASLPGEAHPGEKVEVSVKAEPKAHLKIEVQGEGISQTIALRDVDADNAGIARWNFEISKGYKADKLPVIVTSSAKDRADEKIISSIPIALKPEEKSNAKLELEAEPKATAPGEEVTVTVLTHPGAKVKIEAQGIGISQTAALSDKTADSDGKVSWTFKVSDNFNADKLPLIITGDFKKGEKKLVSAIPVATKTR